MREQGKEFLGAGWRFPIRVEEATGRIELSSHEENIRESIEIILLTRPGERVMQPEFGCHIYDYMFQRPDHPVRVRMEQAVREALIRWEPRIRDIQVMVVPEEDNQVAITIAYIVRSTNNPYNLVFPFYMNEGFGETE